VNLCVIHQNGSDFGTVGWVDIWSVCMSSMENANAGMFADLLRLSVQGK
jgi:hypothetical protein